MNATLRNLCLNCSRSPLTRPFSITTPRFDHNHWDFFGWRTTNSSLAESIKRLERPSNANDHHQNLRSRVRRLRRAAPAGLDVQKFAIETLTPRVHRVKLPDQYTIEPIKQKNFAGRDPNTGRIAVHRRGGGKKLDFYWTDYHRLGASEDADLYERVLEIKRDLNRTAFLALVANGEDKRWVIATEGMKEGDVLKSTRFIPKVLTELKPGDCHPVGAMQPETQICQVEVIPRTGTTKLRAAGVSGQISRHLDNDLVEISLPSKHTITVHKTCLAVVGQNSNANHINEDIGSPNRKRWMGIRPKSGWWQRKTGRFGRNPRPKLTNLVYDPSNLTGVYHCPPPLASRK